jgi:acyl-CoA synthetase (AMP-forming)/AMP-acid ligase II
VILEDYLEINAKRYPQKTAVVCGEEVCTYEALYERVLARTEELKDLYQPGQIVALRAYPTVAYLVEYFALHKAGCVAAPLERDMPEATFQQIAQWLGANTTPEGTADILYTTGTTGRSKGVMISHRTIMADAENLIDGQGFTHELAFVVNGPLNHIGSLSKIYPVIVLGATLIIVDGLKDMNKFFAAFDYPAEKMATFLVPASIRMLIQFSGEQLARYADKIDFIETGAAAISQADMEALCQLLPKTRLYNTYASTETGIIATYNYNGGKCIAGCLGRPMKHSKLIITEDGLIACQGDTLMSGYVGDPERTASILRGDTVYTSDIGMIDEDGLLHLKGREDDVINVGGFKVAPTEVEDAAMSFSRLKDCICIAAEHPITGRALKLLVVMNDGEQLNKRELALHLKERLEPYKVPMLYEQVEKVARTFNGKLDRKHYTLKIKH